MRICLTRHMHMLVLLLTGLAGNGFAQSVGIGTKSPDTSAQLDITSSAQGLLIPRMASSGITSIIGPAKGLMVFDSTKNQLLFNIGSPSAPNWENMVASPWSLTGNAGTNPAIQFIGTTDANPLEFRVDGLYSGQVDPSDANTYFGLFCGPMSSMPGNNTAFGAYSLFSNTCNGLSNNGAYNTALGVYSLWENTTGYFNTAAGYSALQLNTTGNNCVAIGWGALAYNNGNANTGVGGEALWYNSGGGDNTAVGYTALYNTTNSYYNTVLGYNSGVRYNNGYNNVFLGANCDVNGAGMYNVIAIGQDVTCTAVSQARIGNAATNSIGGYANWTNFSDERYKKNMQENVKGIDFIMRLRPLTYQLDVTGIQNRLSNRKDKTPDAASQKAIAEKEAIVFSGFVAQEVEKAARDAGYDFSGVEKPGNANDFYGLRYGNFVVPLVKAVQEQQHMIEALQKEADDLERQLHKK